MPEQISLRAAVIMQTPLLTEPQWKYVRYGFVVFALLKGVGVVIAKLRLWTFNIPLN